MYELWAKKRPVQKKGSPYEYITSFSNIEQRFSITERLDKNIYQECMIIKNNVCVFYREFEIPYTYKLRRKKDE